MSRTVRVIRGEVTFDAEGREVRTEDTVDMTEDEFFEACKRVAQTMASLPPAPVMVSKAMLDHAVKHNPLLQSLMGKKP